MRKYRKINEVHFGKWMDDVERQSDFAPPNIIGPSDRGFAMFRDEGKMKNMDWEWIRDLAIRWFGGDKVYRQLLPLYLEQAAKFPRRTKLHIAGRVAHRHGINQRDFINFIREISKKGELPDFAQINR